MDPTATVRPTSGGVVFTINFQGQERECLISREALNTLSQLKNIDSSDADTLDLFKAFEGFIRPVAQSLVDGGSRHESLQLTPENMKRAYRSPIRFQSVVPATTLPSRSEVGKDLTR